MGEKLVNHSKRFYEYQNALGPCDKYNSIDLQGRMDENIVVIGDKVMNFDSNSQMASQDSGTKLTNLR